MNRARCPDPRAGTLSISRHEVARAAYWSAMRHKRPVFGREIAQGPMRVRQ